MPDDLFDLDAYLAVPRLVNLHVSPAGDRLALTIQSPAGDGRRFESAVWEVPTTGAGATRPLTRPGDDATARGFLPDGSLLMTAPRPRATTPAGEAAAGTAPHDDAPREPDALYVLPAGSGERRLVATPQAGVGDVITAAGSATVVITAALHPGATSLAEDEAIEQARKDAGVQARLVEHYPDRFWDHDIGPRQRRLLALDPAAPAGGMAEPRDLTPDPPWAGWLEDVQFSLTEDGSRLAFGCEPGHGKHFKADLGVLETVGEGAVRILVATQAMHGAVAWSPDGTAIAVASADIGSPGQPTDFHLHVVDASTGAAKEVAPRWHAAVQEIRWARDGGSLLVTADEGGHTPVFRVHLDGTVVRLTSSGAYHNLALSPDGATLYAIHSHINESPLPAALRIDEPDQAPRLLDSPSVPAATGSLLEELTTTAADGAEIHSWLVLPEHPSPQPLPLAVLIHGGPLSSWAGWHWRWSAPFLAAQGWAVLLPDPRLSTGYGSAHISAAWSDWATLPAGDILSAVEDAAARPDVDGDRVAALGGSYGGYMCNWLAVTSDRFRAIVTHASVWDLELERDTSDVGFLLDREFGDPRADETVWRSLSPSRRADSLHTPMLVIHGARDARVPLANAHSLWTALQLRSVPSRLLVYPDENHWILKPQNARLWYQTVLAFLDENVRGQEWRRPPLV